MSEHAQSCSDREEPCTGAKECRYNNNNDEKELQTYPKPNQLWLERAAKHSSGEMQRASSCGLHVWDNA